MPFNQNILCGPRDPEYKVLECCKNLGIGFVPFSPLGRAFLAGVVKDMSLLEEGDMRLTMPRFTGDNLKHNLKLVEELTTLAVDNDCTPAQLALAWLLSKDPDFVPISGTKHVKYVEENALAAEINVSNSELEKAGKIFGPEQIKGERYHPSQMISLDPDV
ncbi:MAG: aldo/keto reductase [Gammaproteobacteria bacterium]|nr:aldo/keto reductase [Gammaproteobacteria bacterium]